MDDERKEAFLAQLRNDPPSMISESYLRADPDLQALPKAARMVAAANPYCFCKMPESMRDNKEVALAALERMGEALQHASARLRDDEDVVRKAVSYKGFFLRWASQRLKGRRGVVFLACQNGGDAMVYCSPHLRSDRELVLAAVSNTGTSASTALKYAAPHLKKDPEIALLAVQHDGRAIAYVDRDLRRTNRRVVLAACKTYGDALRYVSDMIPRDPTPPPLLDDEEIVLTAVEQSLGAMQHASARLRDDKEVVMRVLQTKGGEALQFASERLRDDDSVALLAVMGTGDGLRHVSDRLKDNKEIVLLALSTCQVADGKVPGHPGCAAPRCKPLEFVSQRLCQDAETMIEVFKKRALCFERGGNCFEASRISKPLWEDPSFMREATAVSGFEALQTAANFVDIEAFLGDPKIRMAAIPKTASRIRREGLKGCYRPGGTLYLDETEELRRYRVTQFGLSKGRREAFVASLKEEPGVVRVIKSHSEKLAHYNRCNHQRCADTAISCTLQEMRNSRNVMLQACKRRGSSLRHDTAGFSKDREVVLAAVQSDGTALKYVDPSLWSDREIVESAVSQDGTVILLADKSFLADRELVLKAIRTGSCDYQICQLLGDLPAPLRSDRGLFEAAMARGDGKYLNHASESLCDDEHLVLAGLHCGNNAYAYANERVRGIRTLALAAVAFSSKNVSHVPHHLVMDPLFLRQLARVVRFHNELRRVGKELVVTSYEARQRANNGKRAENRKRAPPPTVLADQARRDVLVDALLGGHQLGRYNPEFSVSALFYFLSLNPADSLHLLQGFERSVTKKLKLDEPNRKLCARAATEL